LLTGSEITTAWRCISSFVV